MKKTYLFTVFMMAVMLMISAPLSAQNYSGGSGTSGAPYLIAAKADLKYLSEHSGEWSKHFKQTANIIFSSADFESGGDFYNGGAGFIPIGTESGTKFSGSYDGDGHTIDGLYINRGSDASIGLFGYTYGATVRNLGVTNVNISGFLTIGGLVGYTHNSTISNCYSTGSVTGTTYVGGLVAYTDNSSISKSYSTGNVNGTENTGGLVGYVYCSTISNCYSTGHVTRSSGSNLTFGGFCGYISGQEGNTTTIQYCYSTGKVYQSPGVIWNVTKDKGFAGYVDDGDEHNLVTFTNNFFDKTSSEQDYSGYNSATGKTTTEMKTQSTFTNWDFTEIWEIVGGDGANYPTFQVEGPAVEPTTQATNIAFSAVYSSQMTIQWTNGNGNKRIVFAKQASTGTASPADETTYTASTTFGNGTQIGSTGWYCVYNGTGSSVTVTGLSASTAYIFQVFEYNGSAGRENYLSSTATNNPKSQSTNNSAPPYENYALSFDGTNDHVNCGTINLSGSAITLETWVKVDAFQSSHPYISQLMGTESGTNNAFLRLGDAGIPAGNQVQFVLYIGSGYGVITSNSTLVTDKWYHIAGTYDGSTMKIYINGILDNSQAQSGSFTSNSTFFLSTNDGNQRYLDGTMDEVRVWNTARSAADIQANMCKKLAGNESGLVAYYQMTNGSGTTLSDDKTSGTAYNGTLYNMNDDDWVTSGAAIGDASISDYNSPSSVNLASTHGDDVTVSSLTGSPSGVQIYRVDAAPNVITPPGNLVQLSPEHYFGVFIAGGTSPTYTLTYNYEGHPGITNESSLDLAYRANNAVSSWTEGNATLDMEANTLTLTNQSGTEYILGTESEDNPLPVILSSFTAIYNEQLKLFWTTQSETDNLGFNLFRSENANGFETENFIQINGELIPGMGTTFTPSVYEFTDEYLVLEGHTYYYWLQSVSTANELEIFGPVSITIPQIGDVITELTDFSIEFQNYKPLLSWTTNCENENLGYFIHRSLDQNGFVLGDCQQLNNVIIPGMGTTAYTTEYSYLDNSALMQGKTYYYWLQSMSYQGKFELLGPVSLAIPLDFFIFSPKFLNNYPNPFNPATTIEFAIKENEKATLAIYNLKGQIILKEKFAAGDHQYHWNAEGLASGVYFYKLTSPTTNMTRKMLLLR